MACTVRQSPASWRPMCRRCPVSSMGACGVAGPMWAAALGGCEWLESWKLGRTLDDAVLDLVRRLADAPLPDPPPVLRALLGHTLDEVLLRGLTALYSLLGCEEQQGQPDGGSDGAAVSATWLDSQYRELAEDERRLGPEHPSVRERQATLDELSRVLRQSQRRGPSGRDPAPSTADTSSWEPSRASSVEDTSDAAGATETGATGAGASNAAITVHETSPRSASIPQDRRSTNASPHSASLMPEWILPGVAESQEDMQTANTAFVAEEESGARHGKKVRFSPDEHVQRESAARESAAQETAARESVARESAARESAARESAARESAAPGACDCCGAPQAARPTAAPCVCPCGKATRICVVRHPECVCDEPSSDYMTGRGTSPMPSLVIAPEDKRKPSAPPAESAPEEAGTGDPPASKAAERKASSAPSLAEKGAPAETDWHSAESTPQVKASGALWRRSSPCPCCPPRRRRPRGPANCPDQILWAVTKICIFPDASRTYEVLTPTFEKPPRATGRTHVVFAMRAPAKPATP